MNTVFDKLRELHGNSIKFITVDVEKSDDIPEKYSVTAVPTFLLLKPDLTVANRVDGADAARLTTMIQEAAKAAAAATAAADASSSVALDTSIKRRLDALVTQQPIVLFMKGSPDAPRCGFSSKAVALLQKHNAAFAHVDVLSDDEVRTSMKAYANWPTFPQLWVRGKLLGGLDIITEMDGDGELATLLKQASDETALLNERLKTLIAQAPVMLFMKGDRAQPRCGFSAQMIKILDEHRIQYSTFDILQDQSVRDGLKKFSNWPTFPQLYANSKLVGGLDVVKELVEEKELESALK